jgi:hypothetical protein
MAEDNDDGQEDGYGALARTYYATMFGAVLFCVAMTFILVQ